MYSIDIMIYMIFPMKNNSKQTQNNLLSHLVLSSSAVREDFEKVLLDKLPDVLDIQQKKNKIKNNLQLLRKQGNVEVNGKVWRMSKLENQTLFRRTFKRNNQLTNQPPCQI